MSQVTKMTQSTRVPEVTFKTRVRNEALGGPNPFEWRDLTGDDVFAGRRVVVFALPGAFTPTVLRHRWRRPARQLRQCPQVMWPSPETRSPGAKPATSPPTSTTSPANSWPIVIGTGMVFRDQSSQL